MQKKYVIKILFLNKENSFHKNEFFYLSIWGLPGVILEGHFGILEAPERPKNHIRAPKSIFRKKLCERRVALASQSGPFWPQVPTRRPQGRPKGAQKEPQETPTWRENRSKMLFYKKRKNLKNHDFPTRKPHF